MRAMFLLLVLTASASAGNTELRIGSSNRALRTSSANAVTDQGLGGMHIGLARALSLQPRDDLSLWVEGSLEWGAASGELFTTMTTDTSVLAVLGGGRIRYTPYRHVALGARLDLGSARTSLTLAGNGHSASDSGWGTITVASAMLDLLAVDQRKFGFGLRLELGYVAATPTALTTTPMRDGDTLRLPTMQSETGDLDLSGRFFALSAVTSF